MKNSPFSVAVDMLYTVFSRKEAAEKLAPIMRDVEADAMADFMAAMGDVEGARLWREAHPYWGEAPTDGSS
ncbi:hypothetical protein [Amycolatopsis sp. NPDC004079]|uniref:hypothetical protein n=1 Tax=Amycolatopsis sp. NPDC004079 TaxID=3154549 RepID=UPI0033AD9203